MSKNDNIKINNVVELKDFSGLKAVCKKVYFPKNIKQVIEIVKLANKNKLKIVPIGGKTGTAGGYSGKVDIGIDLSNFSYIKKTRKNIFTVGAGTKVGLFNKNLKNIGLIVPMTEAPNACVGGAIATDNPGKPYHNIGLINHINSITVISPTAKKMILRPNDKDNSLFCSTIGGEGITGIIIEAEFKPLKLKKRRDFNILFKSNNFIFLEKFWKNIISKKDPSLIVARGVVFPLGLLQIRAVSDDEILLTKFNKKIKSSVKKYKNVSVFEGKIPIGEAIIHQLSIELKTKYKFFPAISDIGYQDKKLNDIIVGYVKNKSDKISLIKELEAGPMKVDPNSDHVFNGRIPSFTKIKKLKTGGNDVYILNYGGSNVGGGTHIAFLGNNLKKIKYHIKNIFKILHHSFPLAKTNEHKASVIRGCQIFFMEGMDGLMLRKKIRSVMDPNRIISTSALKDIDNFKI